MPAGLGWVRLTVPHRDLFLPNVLERDEAIHHRPAHGFPCRRRAVRIGVEGLR